MFECNKPGCPNAVSFPPDSSGFKFAAPASLYCDQHLQELTALGFFAVKRQEPAAETVPITEDD